MEEAPAPVHLSGSACGAQAEQNRSGASSASPFLLLGLIAQGEPVYQAFLEQPELLSTRLTPVQVHSHQGC